MKDPVVAVAVSDVHLSLTPPLAREGEPNWLEAMARPWREVKELAVSNGAVVLVAGDVFDRWNAPSEVVNWALENLPHQCYGIPGNHDLPGHVPELAHRSAYGTLVRAGTIRQLEKKPKRVLGIHGIDLCLYGARLGKALPRGVKRTKGELHVGLVHEYVWVPGATREGAAPAERLGKRAGDFSAYDVVVVGDNHKGFVRTLKSGTRVVNCGTLMRRKSTEVHYRPTAALIHRSGEVEQVVLESWTKDVITEVVPEARRVERDSRVYSRFVRRLSRLKGKRFDFRAAMRRAVREEGVHPRVRKVVLGAMGE